MSARISYKNVKSMKSSWFLMVTALVLPLLFSCAKKDDLEKKVNEKVQADKNAIPQSMKLSENQSQSEAELAAEMYTTGCLKTGEKTPLVKVHPNFKEGLNYLIRQQKSKNNLDLVLNYDLNSKIAKLTDPNEISFEGRILNVEMTGFNGVILSDPKKSIAKKCISSNYNMPVSGTPTADQGGTEICYDLEVKYTKEFLEFYNSLFQSRRSGCVLEAVAGSNSEKIMKGEFAFQNSKKVPAYLKTEQSNLVLKCEDKIVRKFISVEHKISSNAVIANTLDYCGGEMLYRSKVVRDAETGIEESKEIFEMLLAPTI